MEKEFNKADYDFLDKAPLHVFVEEFLKRNESFQADIEKYGKPIMPASESRKLDKFFFEKYGVLVSFPMIEGGKAGLSINLPPPIFAVRPSDGYELEYVYWKDREEFEHERSLAFTRLVSSINFPSKTVLELFSGPFYGIPEQTDSREEREYFSNRLLMLIDLNTPIDQLRKIFDRVMKVNRKRVSSNFKPEQWKIYLMVYDLRQQGRTFPEIAEGISKKFKAEKSELADPNNIGRYHEKCVSLIHGGYRRYL